MIQGENFSAGKRVIGACRHGSIIDRGEPAFADRGFTERILHEALIMRYILGNGPGTG